jgi:hypothetical protein
MYDTSVPTTVSEKLIGKLGERKKILASEEKSRDRIRIRYPVYGSKDPDPSPNEAPIMIHSDRRPIHSAFRIPILV